MVGNWRVMGWHLVDGIGWQFMEWWVQNEWSVGYLNKIMQKIKIHAQHHKFFWSTFPECREWHVRLKNKWIPECCVKCGPEWGLLKAGQQQWVQHMHPKVRIKNWWLSQYFNVLDVLLLLLSKTICRRRKMSCLMGSLFLQLLKGLYGTFIKCYWILWHP